MLSTEVVVAQLIEGSFLSPNAYHCQACCLIKLDFLASNKEGSCRYPS